VRYLNRRESLTLQLGSLARGPKSSISWLSTRYSAHNPIGLRSRRDLVGERGIGRFMGQIFLTGKKANHRPSFLGDVVTNCAAQHGIARFKCIEDGSLRNRRGDIELDFGTIDAGECSEMRRQNDADHITLNRPENSAK